MPIASAHIRLQRFNRRVLRRGYSALRVLGSINPKSIERSTAVGISLFAASSIALQGFVVASGNLHGKPAGRAEAAVAHLDQVLTTAAMKSSKEISANAVALLAAAEPLARADKLVDRLIASAANTTANGRKLARYASLVPADTILPKTVVAEIAANEAAATVAVTAPAGLRDDTFAPDAGKRSLREAAAEIAMTPRMAASGVPAPTRVAFLGGQLNDASVGMRKDKGVIIQAAAPTSVPRMFGSKTKDVPAAVLQKVHFQSDTPERCLPSDLMNVIYDVAEKFGEVQVLSTFRDPDRNRRVGGATRSFHLRCQAIDFRVVNRSSGLLEYLEKRADVGGLKRYPLGFYHIDTGPRRSW